MQKVIDFLKSNILVIKWAFWYWFILWLILKYLFNFDIFVLHNWWKFFHATFHGFPAFVFCIVVYSAIPVFIATTLITYRKKTLILEIKMPEKIKNYFDKIKSLFAQPAPVEETKSEPEPTEKTNEPEFERPDDMPPELYIPYLRAKQNRPLNDLMSSFNKAQNTPLDTPTKSEEPESFPIPTDFDLSDEPETASDYGFSDNEIPTFKDIDFNIPTMTSAPAKEKSSAEKYFEQKHIEYETYKDFVATEKYVIYDHNDGDFWVMDDEKWFASKRQIDSPIPELIGLAQQNGLIPVLYLESQNIMDLPGTTEKFESIGVRVIKSLDELK